MTSLYFAPLEIRNKFYNQEQKNSSSNIKRDYLINQYVIDEHNATQDMYASYQNSKAVLNKLEEAQKKESGTTQAVKQLKKEGRIAEALALEGPKPYPQLGYDPNSYARELVAKNKVPSISESSISLPKSETSEKSKASITGSLASKVAEMAKVDKTTDIYKEWKNIDKSTAGAGSGQRKKDAMIQFASDNGLEVPKKSDSLDEIRYKILMQFPKKSEGEGLRGLYKKTKKNKKTNNIVFYVHKKNAKNTRK